MKFRLLGLGSAFLGLIITLQNCSKVGFSEEKSLLAAKSVEEPVPVQPITPTPIEKQSCNYPGRGDSDSLIPHANGKLFASLINNIYCDKIQLRVCNDGNLEGSFDKRTCSFVATDSINENHQGCSSPMGQLQHGAIVSAFELSGSTSATQCISQLRVCDNGVLKGSSSFSKTSCQYDASEASQNDCKLNWNGASITIKHKSMIIGFLKPTVSGSENCTFTAGVCRNGTVNFAGSTGTVSASCRRLRLSESPNGSFEIAHDYNNAQLAWGFKKLDSNSNQFCQIQVQNENQTWSNLSSSVDCSGPAGSIIKGQINLSTQLMFHWREYTTNQKGLKLRLQVGSNDYTDVREAKCVSLPKGTSASTTRDEDCDGNFAND